ncbi:choline transporter-like protein 1 [Denticeps clupeoides]|uniref:Choline transporter-like protein n=1 Tax=Denticeps clupeoides TaxID=299321 RepID=A0AAY4A3C6_9TELE|nr:choline transporter-like protein 1 [Denticeps clupeoides]XP_028832908.1 choline transporter-like protein 1 [Denticeps clupeoides]
MGCAGSTQTKRDWKPLENRSCTDIPWLILFTLFCIGMLLIAGFSVATGAAFRLLSGYDSYGNTCGQTNEKIPGIELSGQNHTGKRYVFFLDPCNIDLTQRRIKSLALCVSSCPQTTLQTYYDIRNFAITNNSLLCTYDLNPSQYTSSRESTTKCPKLPVPASKSLPVFHRCMPVNISCYAKFAEAAVNFFTDSSVLHTVAAGVMASKGVIIGLCVMSLVLSMILMVVIRYISTILVWILGAVVAIGSLVATGVLWWVYVDHQKTAESSQPGIEQNLARENATALLIYAIVATVFTVVLLLLMFFMRKRVALTIALFHEAGKVFIHIPLLVLQPFWTFLSLMFFWICWLSVLLFLGTAGKPVKNQEGLVEYQMDGPLQYMVWYHAVGLIWVSEFLLACQQMTVAGAVVTYYFTRDKSKLPLTPIVSSILRLMRYHVGTVAKGAFIITLVKIPRLILTYIHNQLKGKENACARCMIKACVCCLWCLEKCLSYLNQNAYTATAINSTNFCTSARDAFIILVENALRVAAINTVGDFILFLGKVLVVSCTAFAGVLLLNYQREYTVWVVPLIIVCLFAFLVAHCFLSVFESVVDVLFLCFAIDTKYNDGSRGSEYYMDKSLLEFVENSRKEMEKGTRGEGSEMRPMRGGTQA